MRHLQALENSIFFPENALANEDPENEKQISNECT